MHYSEQLLPGLLANRQLSYIRKFMSNIVHVLGVENCIADALSYPSSVHPSSALTSSKKVRISPSLAPVLLSPALNSGVRALHPASVTAVLSFSTSHASQSYTSSNANSLQRLYSPLWCLLQLRLPSSPYISAETVVLSTPRDLSPFELLED